MNQPPDIATLAPSAYVKALRAHLNLSTRELADKLGVSHRTVEGWEQARAVPRGPALKMMQGLL